MKTNNFFTFSSLLQQSILIEIKHCKDDDDDDVEMLLLTDDYMSKRQEGKKAKKKIREAKRNRE